jgi:hypothetical protein
MKKLIKFILLVVVSGTLSINGAYGSEEPKYVIGNICESQYDTGKPKDIFCLTESKFLTESTFFNNSGRDIPAGTPVSIDSQKSPNQIRVTNILKDKKIVGVTKESISNNSSGLVQLGNGDPNCSDDCPNNFISNFDTSLFKNGQILYVSAEGGVTNIRPKNAVTIGRVMWSGKADPESYTLQLGEVPKVTVSTWQYYAREGESCPPESDIAPDLECVAVDDFNYVLKSKFPKQSIGDFLQEQTGFAPDATSWLLIVVLLGLTVLIFNTVWARGKSKSENAATAILVVIVAGLGIFGAVVVAVNVIEPFFRGNPVDFSKKILGIPQYFYLLPTILAIVLKNSSKK